MIGGADLPSAFGRFRIAVVEDKFTGGDLVVLTRGELGGEEPPLVRLHSECLTGDALGSMRCDCGDQLRSSLSLIERAGRGALLYLRQEGRGIGLKDKIRAYGLQDRGLDTVDANLALGLPVDARDYRGAAQALRLLQVPRVRLLTNNPGKCRALEALGIEVAERVPLEVPATPFSAGYLRTKAERMGHLLQDPDAYAPAPEGRPRVTVHYAQTLDGRIATRSGNSQWISGEESLLLQHELRAAHDAVMVGVGTVIADNPRLTVRLCTGPQPLRVVMDSRLRLPSEATLLQDGGVPTIVMTTRAAPADRVSLVRELGVAVETVEADGRGRVDLRGALTTLGRRGVRSVLIEGGSELITSALAAGAVDRMIVCLAPKLVGAGIEAVGDLGIARLDEAVPFATWGYRQLGRDLIFDGQVAADHGD